MEVSASPSDWVSEDYIVDEDMMTLGPSTFLSLTSEVCSRQLPLSPGQDRPMGLEAEVHDHCLGYVHAFLLHHFYLLKSSFVSSGSRGSCRLFKLSSAEGPGKGKNRYVVFIVISKPFRLPATSSFAHSPFSERSTCRVSKLLDHYIRHLSVLDVILLTYITLSGITDSSEKTFHEYGGTVCELICHDICGNPFADRYQVHL